MDPFLHYNRMSDDIYWLTNYVVIRMNVALYRKNSKGERKFFYREYEYSIGNQSMVTIRRAYDYYITIDSTYKDNKESVMIAPKDYPRFKILLDTVVKWFTDKKYKGLFAKSNNKLVLTSPIPEAEINGLPNAKSIRCDPIVISYGETIADQFPGVRFTFGNYSADLTIDQLMGFHNLINEFNMLLSAQLMLSSIPVPFGTNRIKLDDGPSVNYFRNTTLEKIDNSGSQTTGIIGRRVPLPGDNKKGIDDLERD